MNPLLTSVFTFLSSPGGQQVVAAGGQALAEAVGGLIHLAHKHASAAPVDPAPAPAKQ